MRNKTLCSGLALAAVCWLAPSAAAPAAAPTLSPAEVLESDPYAARKVFYEDYWQKKIERVLAYVPGAIVCVEAELSQEVEKTVTSESLNGTPVTTFEEESESTRSAGEDLKPRLQTAGAGEPLEQESHRSATSKTTAPMSNTVTMHAGLVPESVWVSVVVPTDYVDAVIAATGTPAEQITDAERRAVEKELSSTIKSAVEPLIPDAGPRKDNFRQVSVNFIRRVD